MSTPATSGTSSRVIIDPVTRIEGHLRLELALDATNTVETSVSVGSMWRGLELVLRDRDPRDAWAFAQRICGVCTGPHALAAITAVENALGIEIPENANSIRNMMDLSATIHDHVVHFYVLHAFDWVDVPRIANADPREAAALQQRISAWPLASAKYFKGVQDKVVKLLNSGQPGPFRTRNWGHPSYRLSPEATLVLVAHYLEALAFQREIAKIHAVFGGKNPHPNWLVGGVPCPINLNDNGAVGALNIERLNLVSSLIDKTKAFVDQVYVPDLKLVADSYRDWRAGGGLSGKNLLAYGGLPLHANDLSASNLLFPRGAIVGGNFREVLPVDLTDPEQIREFVDHSWYEYPQGVSGLHPFDGETKPRLAIGPDSIGEITRIEQYDEKGKYSFVKSPRWRGHAMEVGPLARFVVGYAAGRADFKDPMDAFLREADLPFEALFSALGRTAVRGLEAAWCADKLRMFYDRLMANLRSGDLSTANAAAMDPSTWPKGERRGVGFLEAARGSLAHFVVIADGRIKNYQCVVPTTWNASPRDAKGQIGPYEAALTGLRLADPKRPVEALRVVHSFDPCMACSTHVLSPDGDTVAVVSDDACGTS